MLYLPNAAIISLQDSNTEKTIKSRIFKTDETVFTSLLDLEFEIGYFNMWNINLDECGIRVLFYL